MWLDAVSDWSRDLDQAQAPSIRDRPEKVRFWLLKKTNMTLFLLSCLNYKSCNMVLSIMIRIAFQTKRHRCKKQNCSPIRRLWRSCVQIVVLRVICKSCIATCCGRSIAGSWVTLWEPKVIPETTRLLQILESKMSIMIGYSHET
jgi:hypothetical protein